MSDIYSINKSRIGYAYQYKYALLKILKFMLAGRLRSIRVDFPFFPNSLINLSLDVKLELMDPNESYVYEIKTGDNFKGSKIEELKKVLKNLYLFEQCNKGNNCKKFIVISPEVKSQILDHWNDFLFIKSRNRKNLHNENQTKVQKRVFDKLSFDTNLCMGDFIRFIRQTAFDIGPSYTNDSALDNLSDLEDQVESEVGNFCTKLSLRTSEIEIPAWSVPGTQRASYPCIRLKRIRMSCRVLTRAWPICRTPVTLGGGMTMEKDFFLEAVLALKRFLSFQNLYHLVSISLGL